MRELQGKGIGCTALDTKDTVPLGNLYLMVLLFKDDAHRMQRAVVRLPAISKRKAASRARETVIIETS